MEQKAEFLTNVNDDLGESTGLIKYKWPILIATLTLVLVTISVILSANSDKLFNTVINHKQGVPASKPLLRSTKTTSTILSTFSRGYTALVVFVFFAVLIGTFLVLTSTLRPLENEDHEALPRAKKVQKSTSFRSYSIITIISVLIIVAIGAIIRLVYVVNSNSHVIPYILSSTPPVLPQAPALINFDADQLFDGNNFLEQFKPAKPTTAACMQVLCVRRMLCVVKWARVVQDHARFGSLEDDDRGFITQLAASDPEFTLYDNTKLTFKNYQTQSGFNLYNNLAIIAYKLKTIMDKVGIKIEQYPQVCDYCANRLYEVESVSGLNLQEYLA